MATKFKVLPLDQAHECPFYVQNTRNKHVCAWKQITTPTALMAMTEDNPTYDPDVWDNDCGGSYDNCAMVPLFYSFSSAQPAASTSQPVPPPTTPPDNKIYATTGIDDYDPFNMGDHTAQESATQKNIPEAQLVEKQDDVPPIDKKLVRKPIRCRVSAHKIDDPYQIETDVFVRPTNALLAVDDPLLLRKSNFNIQDECDRLIDAHERAGKHIQMGQVYETSNGGNHPGGVIAKKIYHAVVLSPSRVINEVDIHKAIYRSLMRADVDGAKVVTIQPFDCGTLELGQGARVQLGTIFSFLTANPNTSILNIFIVMDDQLSVDTFNNVYKMIFKE